MASHCIWAHEVSLARHSDDPPPNSLLARALATRVVLSASPILCPLWEEGVDSMNLMEGVVEERAEDKALATMQRRLQHRGIQTGEAEVAAWARRLRTGMLRAVPLQHRFVVVRVVCNAVCTSHSFREDGIGCLLGCHGTGSDDIRHDLSCPVVRRTAAQVVLRSGRWPANGSLRKVAQGAFGGSLPRWTIETSSSARFGFDSRSTPRCCRCGRCAGPWLAGSCSWHACAAQSRLHKQGGLGGSHAPVVSPEERSCNAAWALGLKGQRV